MAAGEAAEEAAETATDDGLRRALTDLAAGRSDALAVLYDAVAAGADAATLADLAALVPNNEPVQRISHALAAETAASLAAIEHRLPDDHYLAGLIDEERGLLGAILHSVTRRLAAAGTLELLAQLQPRASEPTGTLERELPELHPLTPDAETLRRTMIHLHGRAAALGRLRALALVAAGMRIQRLETGTYAIATEMPASELPIVEMPSDGGGVRLELVGAAERWPQVAAFQPSEWLLSWDLPDS